MDTQTDHEVQRRALRARLLAARSELTPHERARREAALAERVAAWLATQPLQRLAFYWPIRDEPDLRGTMTHWLAADPRRSAALPVVEGDTLAFAPWTPRTPMVAGRFDIPEPATAERMAPQLLLIPCVGFDAARFRLGYGGGFYDRTLARLTYRPVTCGVAFDVARVDSIGPQPHDVRLDAVLTDAASMTA
jgi:5,10-methenyltetrahydrofolate synthetase